MLFNSWDFLILLLVTLPLYYLPVGQRYRRVWQVALLLASSAVFYAWEEPRLLVLLSASCVLNAVAVERILFWKNKIRCSGNSVTPSSRGVSLKGESKEPSAASTPCTPTQTPICKNTESSKGKARLWLFWTVVLNLGFLAFFKYAGFLAALLPGTPITETLKQWAAGIPLPVGISFYTFQGISMVVDVWRDDISELTREMLARRGLRRASSIRDTSFYITFFPQLVAGPIVKAHEFVDQIGAKFWRDIDWLTVRRGLITGYFLKVFVADNLAEHTAYLSSGGEGLASGSPIGMTSLLYGYSLQIFADFAGYSLIAIGLGALFGYRLPPNFNFPYLSTSITEFWRRWHLSLSSWLRDYLYIPLGGNRKGAGRTYFNHFLVMFLGGLWHGAAWKFAIWGSLHGVFLGIERLATRRGTRKSRTAGGGSDKLNQSLEGMHSQSTIANSGSPVFNFLIVVFKWLLSFHLVTVLWLTFMMPDMESIIAFFKGIARVHFGFSGPQVFSLAFYGSAVVIYHAWGWLREHHEAFAMKLLRSPIEPLVHGLLIFLVITNPGAPRGFIYFQF